MTIKRKGGVYAQAGMDWPEYRHCKQCGHGPLKGGWFDWDSYAYCFVCYETLGLYYKNCRKSVEPVRKSFFERMSDVLRFWKN